MTCLAGGNLQTFLVHDPKQRLISVAPFADRAVHHALIDVIAPVVERGMDPDSFACRVGKGTDAAQDRAQALCRRNPWCLKTDIRSFFASIDHETVMAQVRRLFKDRRLLELIERIVRSGNDTGCGLPIGSLTSQWLANLYLTPLDRFLRALPVCRGLVRYMDDVVVFGRDRNALKALRPALEEFVGKRLHLAIKRDATQVWPTAPGSVGVPFLGFRITAAGRRFRRDNLRRGLSRLAAREREYRRGRLTMADLAASATSTLSHLARAPTTRARASWLARRQPVEW